MGYAPTKEAKADDDEQEQVYGRIDGSTASSQRQRIINDFNTPGSSAGPYTRPLFGLS
jgi:SNF2 family DNA or RNA helicase